MSELIVQAVNKQFPPLDDETVRSIALMKQWMSEAPTTPEAIAEAEADLLEFKKAINETRRMAGARLIFPYVE